MFFHRQHQCDLGSFKELYTDHLLLYTLSVRLVNVHRVVKELPKLLGLFAAQYPYSMVNEEYSSLTEKHPSPPDSFYILH